MTNYNDGLGHVLGMSRAQYPSHPVSLTPLSPSHAYPTSLPRRKTSLRRTPLTLMKRVLCLAATLTATYTQPQRNLPFTQHGGPAPPDSPPLPESITHQQLQPLSLSPTLTSRPRISLPASLKPRRTPSTLREACTGSRRSHKTP